MGTSAVSTSCLLDAMLASDLVFLSVAYERASMKESTQ